MMVYGNDVDYGKAKLYRDDDYKRKISNVVIAVFTAASIISFGSAIFIEKPLKGYYFNGYGLESVIREDGIYFLEYENGTEFELTFEDLEPYSERGFYSVSLTDDDEYRVNVCPSFDYTEYDRIVTAGLVSGMIAAGVAYVRKLK